MHKILSLSARRAWIEIQLVCKSRFYYFESLSARRAWIEMAKSTPEEAKRWSLSARRAWIEI